MKKVIIYFILFVASIICMTNPVEASSGDLFLNHLDFTAIIDEYGNMHVTETWNIDISSTNTLYKTFRTDRTKYSDIMDVVVTDITGNLENELKETKTWKYHLPKGSYFGGMNEDGLFEIAWGVGLDDDSDTRVYEISYQIKDAITKYSDYAQLYWQFVGEDFEIDAENITGTILLPEHANEMPDIKVWGHTEDLNGEIYVTDTNKINFNINDFRAGRFVEVRTLFPTKMITYANRTENEPKLESVIEEETEWANAANERRMKKVMFQKAGTILVNVIAICLIIFTIRLIIKNIKKLKNIKKIMPSQQFQYYREIPRKEATPGEALAIFTKSVGNFNNSVHIGRIFTATLLDLSLRKIIEFEVNGKEVKIKLLKRVSEELESVKDEKAVYEFLKEAFKEKNEITSKELEKFIKKETTKVLGLKGLLNLNIERKLYEKQLADKQEKEKRSQISNSIGLYASLLIGIAFLLVFLIEGLGTGILLGIIPYVITIIIQIIILSIILKKISILTQNGVDELEKWKGLKKYMEEFSMLDKREIPEIIIWEKFLVYATVFGIADKVLKQLKVVYPNIDEQLNVNTYTYMHLMVNTDFSSSFSNAITSSMSTSYSSATGGGGGFSGGGGGRTEVGGRWWRKIKFDKHFKFC